MRKALIALIKLYQLAIRPVLAPSCRFVPSCSEYATEAVERHGCRRGLWLTAHRLGRCHPLCKGGLDPVP